MLVDWVDDGHWRVFGDVVVDGFEGFHAADVVGLRVEVDSFRIVLGERVEVACPFCAVVVPFVVFEGLGVVVEGDVFVVSDVVDGAFWRVVGVVVAFLVEADVDVVHHGFDFVGGDGVHWLLLLCLPSSLLDMSNISQKARHVSATRRSSVGFPVLIVSCG